MNYTLNDAEKMEACELALSLIESDILAECLALALDPSDIDEEFTSDDPQYKQLTDALDRLKACKEYMAGLPA